MVAAQALIKFGHLHPAKVAAKERMVAGAEKPRANNSSAADRPVPVGHTPSPGGPFEPEPKPLRANHEVALSAGASGRAVDRAVRAAKVSPLLAESVVLVDFAFHSWTADVYA